MFTGIYAALITPYTKSGEVNKQAIRDAIDYLLTKGINGFYICGGTGEGLLLTEAERNLVMDTAAEQINHRVPLIAHVGAPSTREAVRLAKYAADNGADAIASIPPIYYPAGKENIVDYYSQLAEAAGNPVFFYNLPASTSFSLNADLAKTLFDLNVIQGVKYTSSDMLNLRIIMDSCGQKLTVFSGPDEMLLPFLTMDIQGGIGATFNCMPEIFTGIYKSWNNGEIKKAQELQAKANRIIFAFTKYGVIGSVKATMGFLGIDCGGPRGPLLELTSEQKVALRKDLQEAGFFETV